MELGWEKLIFSFTLMSVERSRGAPGGKVHSNGIEARRVLDKLIRTVPSFSNGVQDYKSFWNSGLRASAMFAARSYSAVMGPLLACLTPDIIPEDSRRKLLIFCLECVELFFSIARSPTAQFGGIEGVSSELQRIAGLLSDAVRVAFAGQMFKNKRGGWRSRAAGGDAEAAGGGGGGGGGAAEEEAQADDGAASVPTDDGDLDFYKLHMMLPSHLAHFLKLFGPLWDMACGTAEACGRHLKRLFLSTNRHDHSVSTQLVGRFNETFFIHSIMPRLKAAAASAGAAAVRAAVGSRLLNKHSLHTALPHSPVDASALAAAWNATRLALNMDPLSSYNVSWFSECKLMRNTGFKRVCDCSVNKASVLLQYCPRAPATSEPRLVHDHALQPVKTALLLRPLVFFSAARKGAGAIARGVDFCVAQRYLPLTQETWRSLEYTLYKPRTLDCGNIVVVPVSELSHPLRVRFQMNHL